MSTAREPVRMLATYIPAGASMQTPTPPTCAPAAPLGWLVTDPGGAVIDSGPVIELEAAFDTGEDA